MELGLDFVCASVNGVLRNTDLQELVNGVATDSRLIKPGQLFFALTGEKFDGHNFVEQAFQQGAVAAVVSSMPEQRPSQDRPLIIVNDTLRALQDLARAYRNLFPIPVVAVTGSVGKTTTKEILDCCLKSRFRTHKTKGNYNNDIGLPLSILELEAEHQVAILEMAMRGPGEIARLADIARPNYALITNAAPVHLETMGSVEAVARAKCEVLAGLQPPGIAVINGDNEELVKAASCYSCKKLSFGYSSFSDFQIKNVSVSRSGMIIETRFQKSIETLVFPLPAARLAANVVSAVALAIMLGADIRDIQAGLAEYTPSGHRLHIIPLTAGGIIINDSYNANPWSMAAALETGRELRGEGSWVAVLGDMFELGDYETAGHLEVGRKAAENGVDVLLAIGERSRMIAEGAEEAGMSRNSIHYFPSKEQGVEFLRHNISQRDTVLFKASRGMGLESMVEDLLKGFKDTPSSEGVSENVDKNTSI